MAETLAIFILGAGASATAVAVTTAAIQIGVGLAVSAALAPSRPSTKSPKPEDVLQNVQSPVSPRLVHMGKVKSGGVMLMPPRTSGGIVYVLIAQCHIHNPLGGIGGRLTHFIDGIEVTLSGDTVTDDQYTIGSGQFLNLFFTDGAHDQPALAKLQEIFPDWSGAHQCKGTALALIAAEAPAAEKFQGMYPSGIPKYTCVADWSRVDDPRNGMLEPSENPILHLLDYMKSPDGMNLSDDDLIIESFIQSANDCDELIVSDDGLIPRYRISGSYSLIESYDEVTNRIMASCDGEIYQDALGRYGVRVGKSIEATVTLSQKHLHSILSWAPGPSLLSGYTTLKSRYTDHSLGFTSETSDPWVDSELIERYRQEIFGPEPDFTSVPHHSQARRLSKIKTKKDNPLFIGSLRYDLHAMKAIGEAFVNIEIELPDFGVSYSGPAKVTGIRVAGGAIGDEGSLSYVDIDVSIIDPDTYTWSLDEEGTPPGSYTLDVSEGVPLLDVDMATGRGSSGPGIAIRWEPSPIVSLSPKIQYRGGPFGSWVTAVVPDGDNHVQIGGLVASTAYDIRSAWSTSTDTLGEYTVEAGVVSSSAEEASQPPASIAVADIGGGEAQITVNPSSSVFGYSVMVYRDGNLILDQRTEPSVPFVFNDSPGAGSYLYTAVASDVVEQESAAVETVPASTVIA